MPPPVDPGTISAARAALARAFMHSALEDAARFHRNAEDCHALERGALDDDAAARGRGDEHAARAAEVAAEEHRIDARMWRELARVARVDARRAFTRVPLRKGGGS